MRHIRALEAGSYEQLPGGIFRRGFVRSYVSVLGLEEADWMKRFEESCRASGLRDSASADWATFAENVKSNRAQTYRRMGFRGALVALLLATLAVAGWCGWRLKTHRRVMPVHLAWLMPNSRLGKAAAQ